jgi:hypothetical protein
MIEYFHYSPKKPAILVMDEKSIPMGMTFHDISELFEKSDPIPFIGKTPCIIEVPAKLAGNTVDL